MIPLLADTLVELATSVVPASGLLRINGLYIDVPLEISFQRNGGELEFHAVPPRWRWTTVFDARPGRVQLELRPEVLP